MNASERRFDEALTDLWTRHTSPLKRDIWKKNGRPAPLTPKKRDSIISEMEALVETELLKSDHVKELLDSWEHKKQWHHKIGKPHLLSERTKLFKKWYDEHITTKNCVYIFWNESECLYVGRTINGSGRPTQHFTKDWCKKTTRIDIYGFERRTEVPRFECLKTHSCDPKHSEIKPSRHKYDKHCPICKDQKHISRTLKDILRFK
jgi:hypothetical protein